MSQLNKWDEIRRHYAKFNRQIMATPRDRWAIDPYLWDCGKHMIFMTPIEENFWADCRDADLILYPQYPACGYFIDFANPVAMVGIECDGRAFHEDKERDAKRQSVLESRGWTIYRITGRDCNENWCEETGTPPKGRLLADEIGRRHGVKRSHDGSGECRSIREMVAAFFLRVEQRASQ